MKRKTTVFYALILAAVMALSACSFFGGHPNSTTSPITEPTVENTVAQTTERETETTVPVTEAAAERVPASSRDLWRSVLWTDAPPDYAHTAA